MTRTMVVKKLEENDKRMDGWKRGKKDGRKDERQNGRMDGRKDERKNGRMDGKKEGWMKRMSNGT